MLSQVVKKFLTGALLTLTVGLIAPALASADAPDVTSATGKVVSSDASGIVIELSGTWAWTTHHSNCNNDRAGVGIAVDWGDDNGNHVTTLGADSIDVGVRTATLLNAQDNAVHTTSGGTGLTGFTCGTFNGSFNTGDFTGQTHRYPAGSTIPRICALSYDVHGKNGTASGTKDVTAGGANHNDDNSAQKNASTPGGNQCFTIVLPNHPSVTTDAGPDVTVGSKLHDTATLSGGSADISGTITFNLYGPNDTNCTGAPVFTTTKTVTGNGQYVSADSQVINQAGTYRWIANYGGDAKNDATSNACNAANEDVVVGPGGPTVTTDAGPAVDLGNAIHDTATLAGGSNPTGTLTFRLYGPNDANCTGAAIFTDTVTVNGNHNYASNEFTPTQAGTYRWIANYSGDANNTATHNACNEANENVTVASHPRIQVDKSGPGSALAGSDVAFNLDVTNPGDVPLHDIVVDDARCASAPVLDSKHGDGSPLTLDPGDLWTYKCTAHTSAGDTNLHNVVNACALPPAGAQVCDDDDFDVPLRNPGIHIEKTGPASITAGGTIVYTLDVTNPGDQRFVSTEVVVTDPKCDSAPTLVTKNGDGSPGFLNPGDSWTYTCSHVTKSTDTGTYVNGPGTQGANVDGTDEHGDKVHDDDQLNTVINPPPGCVTNCGGGGGSPNPKIAVVKTGPASAAAGSDVTFTLTVTNPGTEPLTSLTVSDPRCDASAPALQSNNGDTTPNVLNVGDVWVYTCASHTAPTDTTLHNVVTTCAQSPASQQVCATDDADVALTTTPTQQVEPLLPGTSNLRGPTGCISNNTHVLNVSGSRIARVSFYVDGRYVGTRTKPNKGSKFTLTVRGAKLRRGSHRVQARITYLPGSNPQTRTLNLTFARCARAITPKFTG